MPIAGTYSNTFFGWRARTRIPMAVAYCIALMLPALADGGGTTKPLHRHPPQDVELHDRFYSNWMRPNELWTSCCDKKDCAPVTKVRRVGDRWEAQREKDQVWLVIPPGAVEQRRDSPDGRSHLCSQGVTVFCFVAGAGI